VAVLPDLLAPALRAMIVGTAVGDGSAARGHYYAGPGNAFWELLFESGLTDELLTPDRDREILRCGLGLTDLVKRRSASRDDVLLDSDFDVPGFVRKVSRYEPRWVAFNGKTGAKVTTMATRAGREMHLGEQDWRVAGARVFVLPSTSAANRSTRHLDGMPSRLAWFEAFRRAIDGS
jgi:double-stranded uracil-DNA glycosylase